MAQQIKWTMVTVIIFAVLVLISPSILAQDNTISTKFDFETGDMQGWHVTEGKFGKIVCDRELFFTVSEKYNKQGQYYISTLENKDGNADDGFTGIIESPKFLLRKPRISFLVGGGSHKNTYVALCEADGKEIFKANGNNTELMKRIGWNAKSYIGKKIFLRIVDKNTGSWGHITFDDFITETEEENAARLHRLEVERRKREAESAKQHREKDKIRQKKLEKFLADESLYSRGSTRVYQGECLEAIDFTVGGIGSGCIRYDGKAKPFVWQIFNNSTQDFIPHSFLAVRTRTQDGNTQVRTLQTEPVGPFPAMEKLRLSGEYPFAWYEFEDSDVPLAISMELFNPMIPMEAKNSAIPCAIINLTAENKSRQTIQVSYLASQQNAVGFTGKGTIDGRLYDGYGGNTNKIFNKKEAKILHMTSSKSHDDTAYGDMALTFLCENEKVSATASWQNMEDLLADFTDDGELSGNENTGPSPTGQTLDGALAAQLILRPGDKKTITLILSWYFPDSYHGAKAQKWGGQGNMYTNWWTDAVNVSDYLRENIDELTRLTRLYHDTFYMTNFPYWLLDRMTSQMAILRSKTCFWTEDGYFGAWEGCCPGVGCCFGNCNHVWQYAQGHARLFPEIGRRMREEVFGYQKDNGLLPHRHPDNFVAFDGQCGDILGAYREHLISKDDDWLKKYWPNIKKAMDYTIVTWDKDEDGVLSGPQHNTLDTSLGGNSTWLGSLYVSALAAVEKMALLQDEPEAAKRYRSIWESGSQKQNETLWNGEYYIQIPGPTPQRDYRTGCAIDQMLGQWWANQLNLGSFYPADRFQSAMLSVFKYNFKSDFRGIKQVPRKFVADDDMGMQMITWPRGGRPESGKCTLYADEVMTGFEYSAAAAMVQSGRIKEGLAVVKAVSNRYDGRLRKGLTPVKTASWGYSGNPFGDDECGKFYGRSMSVWSVLLALQGFIYDGPAGVIGFKPLWKPGDHISFFTAAEGWGLYTQLRKENEQTGIIELRYGKLDVKSIILELADESEPVNVAVSIDHKPVECDYNLENRSLTISLESKYTLRDGELLSVYVKTR
jgi:uncharacterized protein (DUF608 family)